MKLKESDRATEIEIWEPKWSTREIYISTIKVSDHNVIYFTNDKAKKKYPGKYYIAGKDIRKYPLYIMPTKTGGTIRVYQVSLDELIIYEGRNGE